MSPIGISDFRFQISKQSILRAVAPVLPILLLTSVFWLLSSALAPLRALAAEFSADLIRYYGSEEEGRSRVLVKGDMRREDYMDEGEVSGVSIIRSDLGVIWTLMSEEKVYLEVRVQRGLQAPLESLRELNRIGMKKVLGRETLQGYDCEIVRYTPRDQNQGTLTLWISEALGYPVRVQIEVPGEETQSMEFVSIRPGPIPDSRFQIPAGYRKVGLPGGS